MNRDDNHLVTYRNKMWSVPLGTVFDPSLADVLLDAPEFAPTGGTPESIERAIEAIMLHARSIPPVAQSHLLEVLLAKIIAASVAHHPYLDWFGLQDRARTRAGEPSDLMALEVEYGEKPGVGDRVSVRGRRDGEVVAVFGNGRGVYVRHDIGAEGGYDYVEAALGGPEPVQDTLNFYHLDMITVLDREDECTPTAP